MTNKNEIKKSPSLGPNNKYGIFKFSEPVNDKFFNEYVGDSDMKPINLKKESKIARKKQKSMKKQLPGMINLTKNQIERWNRILELLYQIQDDLKIIMSNPEAGKTYNECFEKKAHSVNNLLKLFNKYIDQVELELSKKDEWNEEDYKFAEVFAEVAQYNIINAIDKESAKVFKMVAKPIENELSDDEIESMKQEGQWVPDL